MDLLPYTLMTILAHNGGHPVVTIDKVAKDYFDLSTDRFLRKVSDGKISIAITKMEIESQKCLKGVLVSDLARYIHQRAEAARDHAAKMAA